MLCQSAQARTSRSVAFWFWRLHERRGRQAASSCMGTQRLHRKNKWQAHCTLMSGWTNPTPGQRVQQLGFGRAERLPVAVLVEGERQ